MNPKQDCGLDLPENVSATDWEAVPASLVARHV